MHIIISEFDGFMGVIRLLIYLLILLAFPKFNPLLTEALLRLTESGLVRIR